MLRALRSVQKLLNVHVVVLFFCVVLPVFVCAKIPILLDTDANSEITDQHAIAYALFNGDVFDVVAITTNRTYNGGSIEEHTQEAERIVALCGATERVPVVEGAMSDYNAIKDSILNDTFDGKKAVDVIIQEAHRSRNDTLVIVALGKLTNVALALLKDPTIASKIRVVWSGSNWPDPNEYTLLSDMAAVTAVFESTVAVGVAPVENGTDGVLADKSDISTRMPGTGPVVTPEVLGRHGGTFSTFGDYSVNLFSQVLEEQRLLNDVATLATLKNSEWWVSRIVGAPVLQADGSWEAQNDTTRTITFYSEFNAEAILNDFYTSMESYVLDVRSVSASFTILNDFREIIVDATSSQNDEGESIVSYEWFFSDGTTAAGVTAKHTYDRSSTYDITLVVTQSDGGTDTLTHPIVIYSEPNDSTNDTTHDTLTMSSSAAYMGSSTLSVSDIVFDMTYDGTKPHIEKVSPGRFRLIEVALIKSDVLFYTITGALLIAEEREPMVFDVGEVQHQGVVYYMIHTSSKTFSGLIH